MKKKYFVHPSSYIDKNVKIDKGTKIWHFCHISERVKIGKNCKFGQNVYVGPNVQIGSNVKVQNNVSIYPGVVLEDGVFCGPSMVFTNIINPRSAISRNSSKFYRKTLIKRGSSIGANATIICGITLGRYSFVGAGAVITKDVADYALVYGNPGSIRGWVCECGEKIIFKSKKGKCSICNKRYKKIGNIISSECKDDG